MGPDFGSWAAVVSPPWTVSSRRGTEALRPCPAALRHPWLTCTQPLSLKHAAKDTPGRMAEGLFLIVRVDSKHLFIFIILVLFLKRWKGP